MASRDDLSVYFKNYVGPDFCMCIYDGSTILHVERFRDRLHVKKFNAPDGMETAGWIKLNDIDADKILAAPECISLFNLYDPHTLPIKYAIRHTKVLMKRLLSTCIIVKSNLCDLDEIVIYSSAFIVEDVSKVDPSIYGYLNLDGDVGIRNTINNIIVDFGVKYIDSVAEYAIVVRHGTLDRDDRFYGNKQKIKTHSRCGRTLKRLYNIEPGMYEAIVNVSRDDAIQLGHKAGYPHCKNIKYVIIIVNGKIKTCKKFAPEI